MKLKLGKFCIAKTNNALLQLGKKNLYNYQIVIIFKIKNKFLLNKLLLILKYVKTINHKVNF